MFIEHRCLDVEWGTPIANHNECSLVRTMTVMEPRKKNGCVGELTNRIARLTASGDGQWFINNPGEEVRTRPYERGEFGRPKPGEKFFRAVVVVKVGFGQRLRVGFSLVKSEPSGGEE
jgi:hypothetical protein